jgi:hypothetical protein
MMKVGWHRDVDHCKNRGAAGLLIVRRKRFL